MWSYYGAKTNIVDYYPKPKHDLIIEPFAGTARYSLKYFDRDVILIDKYDVIIKIWKWLQLCSPKDVKSLPRFKSGENINNHQYNCEEERLLVGFLVGFGFRGPRQTATARLRNRPNAMNYTINKIANNLWKIKHWRFIEGEYYSAPEVKATWFIDPPYQYGGEHYIKGSGSIDFNNLADWCLSRDGQILVCESTRANWLPFVPLVSQNVLSGKYSEAFYTNELTSYGAKQTDLFN